MIVSKVLRTLWSMLPTRSRAHFVGLIGVLFLAGLAEMGGMMVIFGYIHGLSPHANGHRSGPVAKILRIVLQEPLAQTDYVLLGGFLVISFIVAKNTLATAAQFALTRFLMKLNHGISRRLFDAYMLAPYFRLRQNGPQTAVQQIKKIFRVFSDSFSATAKILADAITLIMVGALLVMVSPVLTGAAIVTFGGVGTVIYRTMQKQIRAYSSLDNKADAEGTAYLSNALEGIIDTRLRDARDWFSRRYSVALSKQTLYQRRLQGMQRIPRAANEVLLTSMVVGSVFYLTLADKSLTQALPTLALFGFAGMRMTGAMSRLNTSLQKLRQRAESFDDFYSLVATVAPDAVGLKNEVAGEHSYLHDELAHTKQHPPFVGLTIEALHYQYPGVSQAALSSISLRVEPGQFVSFCGHSGSGKTTLLMAIMGLLQDYTGTIFIGDVPMKQMIRSWHSMLSYVGQDLFIAEGTVRENIAFAEAPERVRDEDVWEALRLASAAELVEKLPKGLSTKLNSGRSLSGGERQRLVIARALYRKAPVLILDEATAALDNVTERSIADAVANLSDGQTVICVAHRLSTIRNSDVIHYMEQGAIVASGTYDELLLSCDGFRAMVDADAKKQEQTEQAN